jgi:predicted AlkP superfamily phosphohydrolase/phosphomutase
MKRRVLLIGWDAADWQVIDPLLDAGLMPNLAGIVERGAIGDLATLHPPYSPILWTSIAAGKRPTRHGITGFIEPTPDGRGVHTVSSLSRKCKALWNILGQNGLRSVVVGWYPSHPVEPINGIMVSDLFVKAGDGEQPVPLPRHSVHPPDWTERMAERRLSSREIPAAVPRQFVPGLAKVDQAKDKRLHSLAHVIAENMNAHSAATEAQEHADRDLACLFYDGIDHISHGFSRMHPPRPDFVPEEDFALYSGVLAACYRWHGAMLGRLLELAGPDVTTIIVSDHGFETGARRTPDLPAELTGPTQDHRQFGVIAMAGAGIKTDERIFGASLLDIAPTVLHLFGMPVGRDMDGKVLLAALDNPAPVQRLDSWDAVDGDAGTHPPGSAMDPLDAVEAMKQLQALGYIAPQTGDLAEAVE